MIVGTFDAKGWPFVRAIVSIPRFRIKGAVQFLLDTGADSTCLHLKDATNLHIPRQLLRDPDSIGGIGGSADYYHEEADIFFLDSDPANENRVVGYRVSLGITVCSETDGIPALLGRDVFNNWGIEYDYSAGHLRCYVRKSRYTMRQSVRTSS